MLTDALDALEHGSDEKQVPTDQELIPFIEELGGFAGAEPFENSK